MKRYRVISMDYDSRSYILSLPIGSDWKPEVKESWIKNKRNITAGIIAEFGVRAHQTKIQNFIDLGMAPFSVVAFHNRFYHQARYAFVIGAHYPALTGTCALGERILNHLILRHRSYFTASDDYKKVFNKDSFADWEKAIDILSNWKVLRPETVGHFRDLKIIRNDNIHFDISTDVSAREYALKALLKMSEIIQEQFAATGSLPWFIPAARGGSYIKKEYEDDPFIKEIYLPNCVLVGPKHRIENRDGQFIAIDDNVYEEGEIPDNEFIKLAQEYGQP